MLAWEYPPKVIGGLARHAGYLSRALAAQGHRVTVLTQGDPALPPEEEEEGVTVIRLPVWEPRPRDFVGWVKRLNFEMVETAIRLYAGGERFDLIHAHDWLAAYAGKTLKHGLALPLIATVHATEYGRNNGLHNDLQRYIGTVEWSLTYEAWRVICCSGFMEQEIHRVFQTPLDKIRIVPNGVHLPPERGEAGTTAIDASAAPESVAGPEPVAGPELAGPESIACPEGNADLDPIGDSKVAAVGLRTDVGSPTDLGPPADLGSPTDLGPQADAGLQTDSDAQFRRRYAAPEEPLLFFMGRLVFEKGVHVLLDALPTIAAAHPGVRIVVAGDGPLRRQLEEQAASLGVTGRVTFYGFAEDADRDRFLRTSQAAIFPSLYEPFGIVALEAMAAGVPVVVGRTGGFAEIVEDGKTGLLTEPGDAGELAAAVISLLSNSARAAALKKAARKEVEEKYSWSGIAAATSEVYEEVLAEYKRSRWRRREPGRSRIETRVASPPMRYAETGTESTVADPAGGIPVGASSAPAPSAGASSAPAPSAGASSAPAPSAGASSAEVPASSPAGSSSPAASLPVGDPTSDAAAAAEGP